MESLLGMNGNPFKGKSLTLISMAPVWLVIKYSLASVVTELHWKTGCAQTDMVWEQIN